jgi:DNA-binding response OmpR family regulator
LVKNILIVDNDLGFVFWLCQILGAEGYETVPAEGIAEAHAVLTQLRIWVDVVIVRRTLPGADAFADELRSSQRGLLKAIALFNPSDEQVESMGAWDGWQVKLKADQLARKIFLSLVQSALTPSPSVSKI